MVLLRWIWTETEKEEIAPKVIYYTLRVLMFILSFVLEDWAIHEMLQFPRQRKLAAVLVASSYVTWTYQTHTFSNSIETLVVTWSMVMIQRILDKKVPLHQYSALLLILTCFSNAPQ
jgi:GPI mannosyltransferase 4